MAIFIPKRLSVLDRLLELRFEENMLGLNQRMNDKKRKRDNRSNPRPNVDFNGVKRVRSLYTESVWWKMLTQHGEALKVPTSNAAKLFRIRFRVPYPIYEELLAESRNWYDKNPCDAAGRDAVPLELKILGALRILGRACCFDGIFELTDIEKWNTGFR